MHQAPHVIASAATFDMETAVANRAAGRCLPDLQGFLPLDSIIGAIEGLRYQTGLGHLHVLVESDPELCGSIVGRR